MGRLTTHVLDTARGQPAAGLALSLARLRRPHAATEPELLGRYTTNRDGRVESPLLEGERLTAGVYELSFEAGDYLRAQGVELPAPAFLDVVPIRFGVADPEAHYHVPLLLSPYGYGTYRGS